MDFKHPQQREMLIEDVRSLLHPNYVTPEGVVVTGCPETVLMQELRGHNPVGCRGDRHRYSDLASKRMWKIPSRPADFLPFIRSLGFETVRAHSQLPGRRRGAQCCVVREKQS